MLSAPCSALIPIEPGIAWRRGTVSFVPQYPFNVAPGQPDDPDSFLPRGNGV